MTTTGTQVTTDEEGCECDSSPLPGVTNSIPDERGIVANIERCDSCCRFEGDLEAALVVQFIHGGRIFYYQEGERDPDGEDENAGVHEFTGDTEGICIAYATDPWIEGATVPTPNTEVPMIDTDVAPCLCSCHTDHRVRCPDGAVAHVTECDHPEGEA